MNLSPTHSTIQSSIFSDPVQCDTQILILSSPEPSDFVLADVVDSLIVGKVNGLMLVFGKTVTIDDVGFVLNVGNAVVNAVEVVASG